MAEETSGDNTKADKNIGHEIGNSLKNMKEIYGTGGEIDKANKQIDKEDHASPASGDKTKAK